MISPLTLRAEYPALDEMFGTWWHEDSGSPDQALARYLECGAPDAAAAADEIDRLLASGLDLPEASLALGNVWLVDKFGTTYRQYYLDLRDALRQAATGTP